MSKNKRKARNSQKEEQQAQRVIKVIFVSLLIVALFMLIAYSLLG